MQINRLTFIFLALFVALLLALLFFAAIVSGCKRSPDPAPPKPAAALVVTIGGLGASQLYDVDAMLATGFPDASLAIFGGWNGYAQFSPGYLTAGKHGAVVIAAHSFGADEPWEQCGDIRILIFLDPVCHSGHASITIPPNVQLAVVFRAAIPTPFITPAPVIGPYQQIVVNRSHNNLPHDFAVLAQIHDLIGAAL